MLDPFCLLRPLLHRLDPETAHNLTLDALETLPVPDWRLKPLPPVLATRLFGMDLDHPLGLAAGFDKNARVFHRMDRLGFAFAEIGGVTPLPQSGNPRPRLFRLARDRAVINRMGFNNQGMDAVAERLSRRLPAPLPVGVNLASNTESNDPAGDFVTLVERFAPLAAFLTIDISCPNTRNGKMFLQPGPLEDLLARINAIFAGLNAPHRPPLIGKIAPDLTEDELAPILDKLIAAGIDGLIISNTTIARPDGLQDAQIGERGGLSGRPLFAASTRLLALAHAMAGDRLTLIGVGGIEDGAGAYAKIRAGASALQLYTALIYRGPAVVREILADLAARLRADGFASVAEAVGTAGP